MKFHVGPDSCVFGLVFEVRLVPEMDRFLKLSPLLKSDLFLIVRLIPKVGSGFKVF